MNEGGAVDERPAGCGTAGASSPTVDRIELSGVREHNLRIDRLTIPRRGVTVITGVSGSGKSSLAFDTIHAEGYRQYADSLSAYVRRSLPKIPRPAVDEITGLSPSVAIDQRTISRNPRSNVGTITEIADRLRLLYARAGLHTCLRCDLDMELRDRDEGPPVWCCPSCDAESPATSSQWFTPNSPVGMCPACEGLGYTVRVDPDKLVADPRASVRAGALAFFGDRRRSTKTWWPLRELPGVLEAAGASLDTPWIDLPEVVRELVLFGATDQPLPPRLAAAADLTAIEGMAPAVERLFRDADSPGRKEYYQTFMSATGCASCRGTRIRPEALAVRLGGLDIAQTSALPAGRLRRWVDQVADELAPTIMSDVVAELLEQIGQRLEFMLDVGLHYLSLDRTAPTLSAGEGQRLRLARQLGSGLVGVTYVLDEPSIGLHARDNRRLVTMLRRLADAGNTVLVVEHDRETMEAADHIVDLGPGAGHAGGTVVASGPRDRFLSDLRSATAAYLRGELHVAVPSARRTPDRGWLRVRGARLHNLRGVDADVPVGVMTAVTGVSGSGKSSLVTATLRPALERCMRRRQAPTGPFDSIEGWEAFRRVVTVTQETIGGSSRSTPATYVGVFDEVRRLFAKTPEAIRRRWSTARFSFNAKGGGRCRRCDGKGELRIEMLFLADATVECDACGGRRYAADTLEIHSRGLDIAQTLDLEVAQARDLYSDEPLIAGPLEILCDVGLGYLRLGQSTSTLSGGESQRLKLARELMGREHGSTLYLIDEPTTGLHFSDVAVLLDVLADLVDRGNTVIVVEHNVEFVAACDWVVDLGPDGGEDGGQVVATGPPETIADDARSAIAPYLRAQLQTGGRS